MPFTEDSDDAVATACDLNLKNQTNYVWVLYKLLMVKSKLHRKPLCGTVVKSLFFI